MTKSTLDEFTLLHYFLKWETEKPDNPFLKQPYGDTYKVYSWAEVGKISRQIAATLQKKGYQKGDRIALLSANCAQWFMVDIALVMGGFISVPLYANVSSETLQTILAHSESKFLFIGKLKAEDWEQIKGSVPSEVPTATMDGYDREEMLSWNEFLDPSAKFVMNNPSPKDWVTFIYTSGTTGMPKGVIHTNKSMISALKVAASLAMLDQTGNRFVSYLPLSHAAERGLVEGGSIFCGGTVGFVESQDTFVKNIQGIQPTHFFGVPRIWEKIQSNILEKLPQWQLNVLLKLPVVSSYIKSKIRRSLGLGKAKIILSGAAPISREIILWYRSIGITIREAYGMSENYNVLSMNPPDNIRPGTVGILYPDQEVKIVPDTLEIIQKCDWLMEGYYKEKELTEMTIRNGWLHTGDMGKIDEEGYLSIIGRVKDIFKTSKGEYITPAPIEQQFTDLVEVDQACVMGSKYAQPFVLVVLSAVGKKISKLVISEILLKVLNEVNRQGSRFQQVKKVIIVKEEWTTENGLLTPSLKMKRNDLSKKYEETLESIYDNNEEVSWE
ncbi:MAG: AMP-binding protein [Bacteroidota bacterium]